MSANTRDILVAIRKINERINERDRFSRVIWLPAAEIELAFARMRRNEVGLFHCAACDAVNEMIWSWKIVEIMKIVPGSKAYFTCERCHVTNQVSMRENGDAEIRIYVGKK